jgi:predicted GIY-YIG superfamily endonuclease
VNAQALHPPVQDKVQFDLYRLLRIQDDAGCYCLCNASGEILYIGRAVALRTRLVQHFNSMKRSAETPQGRISVVFWRCYRRDKLNALERGWIESYSLNEGTLPPLNKVYGQL